MEALCISSVALLLVAALSIGILIIRQVLTQKVHAFAKSEANRRSRTLIIDWLITPDITLVAFLSTPHVRQVLKHLLLRMQITMVTALHQMLDH